MYPSIHPSFIPNPQTDNAPNDQSTPLLVCCLLPAACLPQLACYAGDGRAHYAAHRDASDDSLWSLGLNAWLRLRPYRERAVTAILYLNEASWDTQRRVRAVVGFGVKGGGDCRSLTSSSLCCCLFHKGRLPAVLPRR